MSCQTATAPTTPVTPASGGQRVAAAQDFQTSQDGAISSITAPPQGITAPPENITAPPQGITAPPQGITAPPENITAPPQGITAPPQGITAPPQNMVWVDANQARLQLALANYHEVDASFYDADRLSEQSSSDGFQTLLLGGLTQTVENVVEQVLPDSSASDEPPSETENTSESSEGSLLPDTLDQTLETATPILTNTVTLVDNVLDSTLGLLEQLLPVAHGDLYRLRARDLEARAGFIETEKDFPTFALHLSTAGLERQILSFGEGAGAQHVQQLSESGNGFEREASRRFEKLSATQSRIITRSLTTLAQGATIEVYEERLVEASGMAKGSGYLVITSSAGESERFALATESDAQNFKTQAQALQIHEDVQGNATLYLTDDAAQTALVLDFNLMLKALGENIL